MKNLRLSIPKPCSEKWESFAATPTGGFCSSCSKVVVDFTTTSEEKILSFIKNKPMHSCGRFRPDQLKVYQNYYTTSTITPGLSLLRAGIVSVLLLLVSKPTSAQTTPTRATIETIDESRSVATTSGDSEEIVVGVVTDSEDGEPLPGVNVLLKGSTTGTVTDGNGRFQLNLKIGDVLVFSFIGFTTKEYQVSEKVIRAEISLQMCLDMQIMGDMAINEVYEGEPHHARTLWQKLKELF
jgi:hypothetical protein